MAGQLFTDQTGRQVFAGQATRIVSLVPSITELCAALGLEQEVVGITRFCVAPPDWYRSKTRIGGTKNPDTEKIIALRPDMVLANKEENTASDIETLTRAGIPVWVSDIRNLAQAIGMMRDVGKLTGRGREAAALMQAIEVLLGAAPPAPVSAVCLVWWNPMMIAGEDTFIHAMMEAAGFQNALTGLHTSRYPEVTDVQLIAASPRVLLLPSEPFPFSEKHVAHFRALLPAAEVVRVPGEFLSWYGSRMITAIPHLRRLSETLAQT
jgi:ABC-type Fe3+-hydroxamate transport system substrate-binding protein